MIRLFCHIFLCLSLILFIGCSDSTKSDASNADETNEIQPTPTGTWLDNTSLDGYCLKEVIATEDTTVPLRTFYVDPAGDNDADGLQATPFKTIQFAVDNSMAGDRIYINNGTYDETVTITTSGTVQNPIQIIGLAGPTLKVTSENAFNIRASNIEIRGINIASVKYGDAFFIGDEIWDSSPDTTFSNII